MATILWYVLGYGIAFAYIATVILFLITGGIDREDWWMPFVMPVVFPFWWLYENRGGIAIFSVVLLVLIGIPVLISKAIS